MHARLRPRRQVRGCPGRRSRQPPAVGGAPYRRGASQGAGPGRRPPAPCGPPPRVWPPRRAGEQDGLACRQGPATSSVSSARVVKPMAVAKDPARLGTVSRGDAGGGTAVRAVGRLAAVGPGCGARAPHVPGHGEQCRGRRSRPSWAEARAFMRVDSVATMHGVENLFSARRLRQRRHGIRARQYAHGTVVPLPPQNADYS
jgi:hypothetical protein